MVHVSCLCSVDSYGQYIARAFYTYGITLFTPGFCENLSLKLNPYFIERSLKFAAVSANLPLDGNDVEDGDVDSGC